MSPDGHAGRDKNRDKLNHASPSASFGAWVRSRRRQLDLTQAGLAERAACSEAAIRKIEAGERKPSRDLALALANALQIHAGEIDQFLLHARGVYTQDAPAQTKQTSRNNLPALLTSTVNRKHDLQKVCEAILQVDIRLVTLVGPPGIGKTRLSLLSASTLADEFPDGVWFVDLSEFDSSDLFISAIAHSLSGLEQPPLPDIEYLVSALRNKRLLLILDNFEHLVESAAEYVAVLLKTCPNIKVLTTSRIPLGIYGEHEYPVPPLSFPPPEPVFTAQDLLQFESIALFSARAAQRQPAFRISSENAAAVADICTTLEGVPLAIELAAASLSHMTLAEIVEALHHMDEGSWLDWLSSPMRDLPARQRTLANVVAWSYRMLDAKQQELFGRLSIFAGWFDVEAAAAVCFPGKPPSNRTVRAQIEGLAAHSLLVRSEIQGKSCWRMLEIIHEYARLQLGDERPELQARHASHYLQRLAAYDAQNLSSAASAFFDFHRANFNSALNWAIKNEKLDMAARMVFRLNEFWFLLGYFREGLLLMQELLAAPARLDPTTLAGLLQVASDLAWQQHDFDAALNYAQRAADLGRSLGSDAMHLAGLHRLGRIYIEKEEYLNATETLAQTLDLARQQPHELPPSLPLTQMGELALFQGQLEDAQALLLQAEGILPPGEYIFRAMCLTDLAEISIAQGDLDAARGWLALALDPAGQHIRRTLIFLLALGGYLGAYEKENAHQVAACIYGALEGLSRRAGVKFSSYYRRLIEKRMAKTAGSLPPDEWQLYFETGRAWSRDQALAQAKQYLS